MKKTNLNLKIVNDFLPQATFDYHNLGILNSYEIEKYLNEFIQDCRFLGYIQVLIITGKGQVRRPLVSKLLKQSKEVSEYKTAGYFNGQEGAIEVTLK